MPKYYEDVARFSRGIQPFGSELMEKVELAFKKTIRWKECYNWPQVWINVSNNTGIIDWAGNESNIRQKEMSTGLWQSDSGHFQ